MCEGCHKPLLLIWSPTGNYCYECATGRPRTLPFQASKKVLTDPKPWGIIPTEALDADGERLQLSRVRAMADR